MSLVLNTNENGAGKISNAMLDTVFPNFDYILIKPEILKISGGQAIGSVNIESVNGTPIDYYSAEMERDRFFVGNNNGTSFGIQSDFTGKNTTASFRVATIGRLSGGEIIGKEIIWKAFWGYNYYSSQNTNFSGSGLVRLLHTDGTFTDIGTVNVSGSQNKDFNEVKRPYFRGKTTTNGVVALSGDRIAIDFTITLGAGGSYGTGRFSFGTSGSSKFTTTYSNYAYTLENIPPCPVQISIE